MVSVQDTKLLAISRVKNGESIRSVALDLGIIEPTILGDWIKLYDKKGEGGIKTTYARADYMTKDQLAKHIVDKTLKEENERLRAEIEYLKKSSSLAQKLKGVTNKEKAIIVTELRREFKLEVLLGIAELAPSTYYDNIKEDDKVDPYKEIKDELDHLYLKVHKKRIGYQKIYNELNRKGFTIGKNKVYEIMKENGYLRVKKKKWRRFNSYVGDLGWTKPNHMNRDFTTTAPYQKGGTDITIFLLENETVYLSPIIDFHTREILSYSLGTNAKMNK